MTRLFEKLKEGNFHKERNKNNVKIIFNYKQYKHKHEIVSI